MRDSRTDHNTEMRHGLLTQTFPTNLYMSQRSFYSFKAWHTSTDLYTCISD